jgi:hypothetical protein
MRERSWLWFFAGGAAAVIGCSGGAASSDTSSSEISANRPERSAHSAKAAAVCDDLDENQCVATSGCEAGYLGTCDCFCPGPAAPAGSEITQYEARECTGCSAECHVFAACLRATAASPPPPPPPPPPAKVTCEGADEATCRSSPTCRPEMMELCDCTCADAEAAECFGCPRSCRPFTACHTR